MSCANTPVYLFRKEKELFVEQSDLAKGLTAQHPEGAIYPGHFD